jgi:hypothetical protein
MPEACRERGETIVADDRPAPDRARPAGHRMPQDLRHRDPLPGSTRGTRSTRKPQPRPPFSCLGARS